MIWKDCRQMNCSLFYKQVGTPGFKLFSSEIKSDDFVPGLLFGVKSV